MLDAFNVGKEPSAILKSSSDQHLEKGDILKQSALYQLSMK